MTAPPPTDSTGIRPRRLLPPALGAVGAQVMLAASTLLLQVLAARTLGAEGLGTFALLFGLIVMATAASTGLVGDSLTVLDRRDPEIRSALAWLALATIGLACATLLVVALADGWLPVGQAVALAVATAAFMVADLCRRLLMAVQRFWVLVAVDAAGMIATVLTLAGCWLVAEPTVGHLLVGLAVGQGTAATLAWRYLPGEERERVRLRPGRWRAVVGFGAWRAVQQFVRPTTLNAARWLVLVAAGAAAVGELEAARVFVAPAMVLVQGVGSYLFASYAADRSRDVLELRRRADRAAGIMLAGAVLAGLGAAALAPVLGGAITADGFALSTFSIIGWTAYTASCAAVLPYGSLAAVRGQQARVLGMRVLDSFLSLCLVAVALHLLGWSPSTTPWLLSIGSFAGGLLCRQVLLGSTSPAATGAQRAPEQVPR